MVWWTPSIGRKVGITRGILPHVQTGLTNWNPDNSLSHPGLTNYGITLYWADLAVNDYKTFQQYRSTKTKVKNVFGASGIRTQILSIFI